MPDAIVIKPFYGGEDGEIYGRQFNIGDTVRGDLALVALKEGWAELPKATPKTAAIVVETSVDAAQTMAPASQTGFDLAGTQSAQPRRTLKR